MSAVDGVRGNTGHFQAGAPGASRAATAFAMPAAGHTGPANGAAAASAPMALDGMLALQEMGADAGGESAGKQYASALLAELAALQRALLIGGDPAVVLRRLNAMMEDAPFVTSPQLVAILAAVRVRARVELARRGVGVN